MKNQSAVISTSMVAACGITCSVCLGHLRDKNKCPGCFNEGPGKPHHCVVCTIRNCPELTKSGAKYCFACRKFPCSRLHRLDRRYKTKYHMSMIENLEAIRDHGIRRFIASEKERWTCPACGALLSVHREACLSCGSERMKLE